MQEIMDGLATSLASGGWLSPELIVLLIAMIPVAELRVAVPAGVLLLGLDPLTATIFAMIGNFLPVIPIILLLPVLFDWFYKFKFMRPFMDKIVSRTRAAGKKVEKKGAFGLFLFVAVPLPGTGVWGGCLLSYLLGISSKYAIFSIFCGMVAAGIGFGLSFGGLVQIFKLVSDLEYLLLALLLVGALVVWLVRRQSRKNPQ